MKSLRRIVASLLLVGSLFGGQAAHAGIPVIDAANLAQAVTQVLAWEQQYQQMVSRLQQAGAQLSALTGSRNLGQVFNNPLIQQSVPGGVAQTFGAVAAGGFSNLTSDAAALRSATMLYNCGGMTGTALSTCSASLNVNSQAQAQQQSALALVTQRISEIQNMQNQINATADPMAAAQVQAALQAETAQVANDMNRITLMNAMAASAKAQADQTANESVLALMAPTKPTVESTFVATLP